MCWNPVYSLLLLGVTFVTYLSGRIIEKLKAKENAEKKTKLVLGATIVSCILVLALFKYLDYIFNTLCIFFRIAHIGINVPTVSLVIPVGISFYLFQSMGYVIDIYRGKINSERNFILYGAYISFFPQLVAGPIERADKLLPQFYEEHKFDFERVKSNLLLMLWGFFMKIVIVDRIAIFVDGVYNNYEIYGGVPLIVATLLFAFQIYCDFAGYSLIAKGAAGVMGFELMDNFNSPYCASGVREFWSRWHISLTSWFRDYVYIPLGGNRKGKVRKYINTIIVFLLSGLWHGPSWSFVFWGGLNGMYIVLEELFLKAKDRIFSFLHIKLPRIISKTLGIVVTFILVDFSWIFFRSTGLKDGIKIIKSMLTFSNVSAFMDNTVFYNIIEKKNFIMIFVAILILVFLDICHYNGIRLRTVISRQNIVVRWCFYWTLIMSILIFGIWGPGFDQAAFIYFQF